MHVAIGCYDGGLHGWRRQDKNAFEQLHAETFGGDNSGTDEEDQTEMKFQLEFAYKAHMSCIKCLAASNNRKGPNTSKSAKLGYEFLASGGTDEIIRVYRLGHLMEAGELIEHTDTVLSLEFIGNKFLLSGGQDGKLLLWRCRDWNLVASLKGHRPGPVTSISVHPTGKVALTTSNDNSLRMWNLETARPASRNRMEGVKTLNLVTWSPTGLRYVVIGDDKKVMVFSVDDTTGKPAWSIKLDTRVNSVVFVSENVVAVGLDSGKVRCLVLSAAGEEVEGEKVPEAEWDCGARVRSVVRAEGLSHNRATLIVGLSDGKVQFWDVATASKVNELQGLTGTHLTCLIATPDPAALQTSGSTLPSKKRKERKDADSSGEEDNHDEHASKGEEEEEEEEEEEKEVKPTPKKRAKTPTGKAKTVKTSTPKATGGKKSSSGTPKSPKTKGSAKKAPANLPRRTPRRAAARGKSSTPK